MNFEKYSNRTIEDVLRSLRTRPEGLAESEARELIKIYGLNEIEAKKTTAIQILLRQAKSAFFFLLLAAALVSFLIPGEKTSTILILIFLIVNLLLGFLQEYRAERSLELLKTYFSKKARALRDERETVVDKKNLVPGDIVLLEAGSIVPADLRIIKSKNFFVDESILTGESTPVLKTSDTIFETARDLYKAENIVFAGTLVSSGKAEGVVIGTGKLSAFGEITRVAQEVRRRSSYEKNISGFSKIIFRLVIVTIIILFLANLAIKGTQNLGEFSVFCIALLVGIIPETLPVVMIFSLSQGALKLARQKVIARRLSAVEDLGDIEILCTDKTGTLTENNLTVCQVFSQDKDKCLLYGILASSYLKEDIESVKDPFDNALYLKASRAVKDSIKNFWALSEIAFDPTRGYNSALVKTMGCEKILIARGAPEKILGLCSRAPKGQEREKIAREFENEGRKGKRVLAVACKKFHKTKYSEADEEGFVFLGYITFSDPLKKTAKHAVDLARRLGVQVKILTGDGKEVAESVGRETGLIAEGDQAILGSELKNLNDEDFEKECQKKHVFARVCPATKFKIITVLQKKYEVGFLGEGINDVPSLKAANVAIAVDSATDVSKEASDIVLLNKDLKVIMEGIKQGRNIFSNVQKYIKCTLASNFGNCYSMAAISLMIPYLPILPLQVLLLNLLSDFPLIAVAFDTVEAEELKKPKSYDFRRMIFLIAVLAATSSVFDFMFFNIFNRFGEAILQTSWFMASTFTEIALIFSIRTRHFFLKAKKPSFTLVLLAFFTVAATLVLPFTAFGQNFFKFIALPAWSVLLIVLLACVYFAASEAAKLLFFKSQKKETAKIPNNF